MNLTETQKAYLAGIIDGEGSIVISKFPTSNPSIDRYQAYIIISNTDTNLLDYISEIIGYENKKLSVRNKEGQKLCYNLVIGDPNKITELLNQIIPYLFSKKNKALILLEYINYHSNFKRMKKSSLSSDIIEEEEALYLSLKMLNIKGDNSEL